MSRDNSNDVVREPWSPKHIGWLALFLSPIPSAVLHALNWGRLGQPERVRSQFLINFGAVSLLVVVAALETVHPIGLYAIGACFAWYFGATQLPAFNDVIRQGGRKAPFGKPFLWSCGGLLGLLVIIGGMTWALDARDMARLQAMLDRGEYEAYEAEMLSWVDADPTYSGGHYNLALVYSLMDRYEDVAGHLRTYVNLEPDDVEAQVWLAEVEEYLQDPDGYSTVPDDLDVR